MKRSPPKRWKHKLHPTKKKKGKGAMKKKGGKPLTRFGNGEEKKKKLWAQKKGRFPLRRDSEKLA